MEVKQRIITTKPNYKKRILACCIDYGIMLFSLILLFYFFGKTSSHGGLVLNGVPLYFILLLWSLITIISEQVLGASIGNLLMQLKPVSLISNKKLDFSQSVKRHLLVVFDLFFFGLVAYLSISNTKHHQRLGDIWGKSIVVDLNDNTQGISWQTVK